MRLALHFDFPGLQQTLRELLPDLDIVTLPSEPESELPADLTADALLSSAHLAESNLPQVLRQCRDLKWVHVFGAGIDNFPLHLIGERVLTCGRGSSAVPIAEWALAMMLNFEKKLPDSWIISQPDDWFAPRELGSLANKTLGIVGYGTIGRQIAKRALAFDMRVLAKVRTHRDISVPGVELLEDLDTLLQQADHLVLALPATPETEQLINARALAQTKRGVHIVNVARASILSQDALRPLLDSGHVAGASLDVVAPEPLPDGHWLYGHTRVRLSPHTSWNSPEVMTNIVNCFLENLKAYSQGEALTGVVDIRAGY